MSGLEFSAPKQAAFFQDNSKFFLDRGARPKGNWCCRKTTNRTQPNVLSPPTWRLRFFIPPPPPPHTHTGPGPLALCYISHINGGEHHPNFKVLRKTLCEACRHLYGRDAKGQKQHLSAEAQLPHSPSENAFPELGASNANIFSLTTQTSVQT